MQSGKFYFDKTYLFFSHSEPLDMSFFSIYNIFLLFYLSHVNSNILISIKEKKFSKVYEIYYSKVSQIFSISLLN